ncbi:MAG: GTP-binding protein [bacterium]|nr:GTP-binding protein [bacterium]
MSPVTVITGFLGSGKTTLINALVRHPAMAGSAVIVNEFGETGVDHLLIERLDEATMLVGAGCLCCEVREDVVVAIMRLVGQHAPNHIIIETSGLADPAPLVHTLLHDERINRQVTVAGIVATVDALAGERPFDTQAECLRQAAVADTIILTKTDLAPGTDRLEARLRALNGEARILASPVTPDDVVRHVPDPTTWIQASSSTQHDSTITSLSLTTRNTLEAAPLMDWIERVIVRQGDRLLRFKGIVDLLGSDVPIVINGIGHVFHPLFRLAAWPSGMRGSRIVLIGHQLDTVTIEADFSRLADNGV